jgi:predicted peroxiredoxin
MRTASPETRACLDFAFRMVLWDDDGEVYVYRDGTTVATTTALEKVKLGHPMGALTHFLAKAMQAHLRGVDLAQCREEVLAANVGKLLADKVYDHLGSISVGEWQRLRERVAFYMADDNTALSADPSADEGTT